jgi:hypothetical protein
MQSLSGAGPEVLSGRCEAAAFPRWASRGRREFANMLEKMVVVHERMDRQQFDRGDTERTDVARNVLGAEARIGAPQFLVDFGMTFGKALDVGLIDDRPISGDRLPVGIALPVEVGIDHHAFRHDRGTVPLIKSRVVAGFHLIAKDRRVPDQFASMRPGIRIEQQFVWVKAMAILRRVQTMHAVAVESAGANIWKVIVKNLVGVFRQFDPHGLGLSGAVKKADFDLRGVGGEQREIGPLAVLACALWVGETFLDRRCRAFRHELFQILKSQRSRHSSIGLKQERCNEFKRREIR